MNPIALYLASGESLYAGALILLTLVFLSPRVKGRWPFRLRNLAAALGFCLVVFACAPFPWLVYALFCALFVTWFIVSQMKGQQKVRRMTLITTIAFALLVAALPLAELPHRRVPTITGEHCDGIAIIGDSLSAGIDPKESPWPVLLEKIIRVPVKNLSQAGAQMSDAPALANKLLPDDRWVLIEMGGNDLIANVPSDEFERGLDRLLQQAASPGRRLLMFELPLLPHKIAYGRIQRRLATRYDVTLLPKRLLIDVLRTADGTSDGLHLSSAGADRMAAIVAEILAPVTTAPADPHPTTAHTASNGKTPA